MEFTGGWVSSFGDVICCFPQDSDSGSVVKIRDVFYFCLIQKLLSDAFYLRFYFSVIIIGVASFKSYICFCFSSPLGQ